MALSSFVMLLTSICTNKWWTSKQSNEIKLGLWNQIHSHNMTNNRDKGQVSTWLVTVQVCVVVSCVSSFLAVVMGFFIRLCTIYINATFFAMASFAAASLMCFALAIYTENVEHHFRHDRSYEMAWIGTVLSIITGFFGLTLELRYPVILI